MTIRSVRCSCLSLLALGIVAFQPSVASAQPAAVAAPTTASSSPGSLVWTTDTEGVTLTQAGAMVLRYEFKSGRKPIVYPLIGPGGLSMTRDYPMKPSEKDGSKDHPHHRSLWMTHGEVNDIDFWMEADKAGRIEHDQVVTSEADGTTAKLATTANWITPDGQTLLHESRTMTVSGDDSLRGIEFSIDLTAGDQKVHFGDTKEGSFGIRVPDTMAVDRKLGGSILNEHGERDGDAWGKRSRWVDYSGPIGDQTAGITILEHPASFGAPCRWHVRTYGLFAANPFMEYHASGGQPTAGHTLQPGETMHLKYKVLLHPGPANAESIEAQWKSFAGQ